MSGSGAGAFSVVVAAWSGPAALARCLTALVPQLRDGDEVVVAHNFSADRAASEASAWAFADPRVRLIGCADDTNVPRLRAAGLARSHGAIVAFLEDHAAPLEGWRDAIVAGFEARAADPPIAAVGGPVAPPARGTALDDAVWFYDYGRFAPPMPSAFVTTLSGANIACTRASLRQVFGDETDPGTEGLHEASLERALLARGGALWLAGDAVVRVTRRQTPVRALALAFALARGFAARRAAGSGSAARWIRVLTSPLVPCVLFVRSARSAWRVPTLRGRFVRAAGWLLLLQGTWGLGEGVGGCCGAGAADARWR